MVPIKTRLILIAALVISSFINNTTAPAQNQVMIDSLTELLSRDISSEDRAVTYVNLSYEYSEYNFEKSVDYAEKALALSQEIKYVEGEIVALTDLGFAYWIADSLDKAAGYYHAALNVARQNNDEIRKGHGYNSLGALYKDKDQYDVAFQYYDSAIKIWEKFDDKHIAATFNNIANLLRLQNKYDSSIQYYLKSVALFDESGDKRNLCKVYNNIGLSYDHLGNFPKALEYHHQSLTLAEALESARDMAASFSNIGRIHVYQREYHKAIDYEKKALGWNLKIRNQPRIASTYISLGGIYRNIEKYDSAIFYHEKGLAILKGLSSKRELAHAYKSLGDDYKAIRDYDQSLYYLNKSLEISEEVEASDIKVSLFNSLGQLKVKKKAYKEAIDYFKKAVALSEQLELPIKATNAYELLADAQYANGDYKEAYESFSKFHAVYDTLLGETKANEIANLEIKYETEKKEQEIENLSQKAQIQGLELDRKNQNLLLLVILLVLSAVVAGLIYVFNRQKRLSLQHKAQDMEQRLLRTQMNPHFIFNSMVAIQDYVEQGNSKKAGGYLTKFSKLIRQVLDNSRSEFIRLDDEINMLENYLSLQNLRRDIPFNYTIDIDERIHTEEIAIPPMFAQPFVENAIEHGLSGLGQDAHINIRFLLEEDHLVLEVSDNGKGDEKNLEAIRAEHVSHATKITQERIALFKKMLKKEISFDLQSLQTGGTAVIFNLPFKYV